MKKHDYAAALDFVVNYGINLCSCGYEVTDKDVGRIENTIRHALRFAEKMMQGPSDGMFKAGDNLCIKAFEAGHDACAEEIFKSMRDAAIKELGE